MEWEESERGRIKSSVVGEGGVDQERPWRWMSLERKRTSMEDSCEGGDGRSCWRQEVERRRPRVWMVMAGRRLVDEARLRDLSGGGERPLAMFKLHNSQNHFCMS